MQHIAKAALATGSAATTWFGHWLEDEIPKQLASQKYAAPLCHDRPAYTHEQRYRDLLGLPLRWRVASTRIDELIVVDEFAQNPHKTSRYQEIRRRVSAAFPQKPKHDRVFLIRGQSGVSRPLINEMELAEKFENEGYCCIDVGKASLDQLLAACVGASIVVSVEGSHLAHCLYALRRGGTMIILNPPQQVHTTIADIGVFCGLHSGMFICETDTSVSGGFRASFAELETFIEDAVSATGAQNDRLQEYLESILKRVDRQEVIF